MQNYKKQLAERMAREKYDKGELLGGSGAASQNSGSDFIKGMKQESNDMPDSRILLAILDKKSKFDKDLKANF